MNKHETEGWVEDMRRRTDRIFRLAFLIMLIPVLIISVWLFFVGE